MTGVTEAAVAAALAVRADLLSDRPSPMVLPEAVLVRRQLEAALPHLLADPGPDLTAVPWRHGGSHERSIYAEAGFSDGKPGSYVGHMDTGGLAAEAITAHNAMLDLDWLLSCRLRVLLTGWPGGHAWVRLILLGGGPDQVFTGCTSVAEGLAKAREWAEQEGITP